MPSVLSRPTSTMAPSIPKNSVWSAMGYPPPQGPCNHKTSLMSPACPCLRFMLHPVKAATSFECDGCSHHASFHSLENPAEDAVVQKWAAQREQARNDKQTSRAVIDDKDSSNEQGRGTKRRRIAGKLSMHARIGNKSTQDHGALSRTNLVEEVLEDTRPETEGTGD